MYMLWEAASKPHCISDKQPIRPNFHFKLEDMFESTLDDINEYPNAIEIYTQVNRFQVEAKSVNL